MAQHACEQVQRERKTLNNAKQLLKKLRGDDNWIPCGLLYSKSDEVLFSTEHLYNRTAVSGDVVAPKKLDAQGRIVNGIVNGDRQSGIQNGSKPEIELANVNGLHEDTTEEDSVAGIETAADGVTPPGLATEAQEVETLKTDVLPEPELVNADNKDSEGQGTKLEDPDELEKSFEDEIVDIVGPEASITGPGASGDTLDTDMVSGRDEGGNDDTKRPANTHTGDPKPTATDAPTNEDIMSVIEDTRPEDPEDSIDETKPSAPRMQTRARTNAAASAAPTTRTASPSSPTPPPPIHPLFIIPPSAIPSRNIDLPPAEAEETRRLLTHYVQKQEEVCRSAEKLYEGLLRADRQRLTVFKWCKAEGHVGEMSDGEDWYDREEWGLDEEGLRKGHNDDEDEGVAPGKKTRGRRA